MRAIRLHPPHQFQSIGVAAWELHVENRVTCGKAPLDQLVLSAGDASGGVDACAGYLSIQVWNLRFRI